MALCGTRTSYKRGCRCDDCVQANRKYFIQWRARDSEKARQRQRRYRKNNPNIDREYYEANKEKVRAANDRWAQEHAKKVIAYNAQYYLEHQDEIIQRSRQWELDHPEGSKRLKRKSASTRRARKLDQFVEDIDPHIIFDRDEGICGICCEPVDRNAFHVDHVIPLSKGGEHGYANTQLTHPRCNMRKSNKSSEELYV